MKRAEATVLNKQLMTKADGFSDLDKLMRVLDLLCVLEPHCLGATRARRLNAAHSLSAPSGNALSGHKLVCVRPTTMMLVMSNDNLSALRGWVSPTNTASTLRLQKTILRAARKVFGIYFPVLTSRPVRENKKPSAACFFQMSLYFRLVSSTSRYLSISFD